MTKTQITLRIPREVYKALERMSIKLGLGITQLIIIALLFRYDCI